MERILLVEPNYKNKYPPIGLMKISSYYKRKGDFVQFHKGLLTTNDVITFDKVLITTLFTFDFDICVRAINYYVSIIGSENVYVGGIAATIMPEKFREEIPGVQLLTGQLTSSNVLGYTDNVNVDLMELDYDILWDVSYEYPAADSYFIYTTRGCPRKCSFCAVKTLEPRFYDCENIRAQIENVDRQFGIKKQLLIMDNNILYSEKFSETIDILKEMGFGKKNNKIQKNSRMKYYIASLERRRQENRRYDCLLDRMKTCFSELKFQRIKKEDAIRLKPVRALIDENREEDFIHYILDNREFLEDFFDRYHYHKISRYVDFNQGLDARLFDKENAAKLGEIAVNPCRIAFDSLNVKDEYLNAMTLAYESGVRKFSNYLLYNYDENPKDLWERLNINIQFCQEHAGVALFSFPMRYASISDTERSNVGKEWHKKYLRAMNVILNVTSGIVAKEEDFFRRAYGGSPEEFLQILTMPDEFIRFRDHFERCGLTQAWVRDFTCLSEKEKDQLLDILDRMVDEPEILEGSYSQAIDGILGYYRLKKKDALALTG